MNAVPMQEMFNQVFPRFSNRGLRSCVDLMMKNSDVQLSDKETRFCYGMSKMTIREEVEKHDDYDNLKYVEFLEFVGRVAHLKYIDDTETPLENKIEMILDDTFPVFGLKRKIAGDGEDNDETSEESVIVDEGTIEARISEKGMKHQFVF